MTVSTTAGKSHSERNKRTIRIDLDRQRHGKEREMRLGKETVTYAKYAYESYTIRTTNIPITIYKYTMAYRLRKISIGD